MDDTPMLSEKEQFAQGSFNGHHPHQIGQRHTCNCWDDGKRRQRRIRILQELKVFTIVCGILAFTTWGIFGWNNGYLFDENPFDSIGLIWGGGGDVVVEDKMWNDFTEIKPSKDLDWKPCYDKFQCARLTVPLDYSNPKGPTAQIALAKFPAKVSTEKHLPSILLNPGGPGGSGVMFALLAAESIQMVVGEQYPIIGFDPRGINNTTPSVDCFESCPLSKDLFNMKFFGGSMNLLANMADSWTRAYGFGLMCEKNVGSGKNAIAHHVSTPAVARDMLSIVEAEQREAGLKEKHGKLHYWGFSYGSILGQTFASLFPDRVGRLIVDGVVDMRDYYEVDWKRELMDSEYVMDQFYELCFRAGPLKCSFHTGSSPSDVRKRVQNLIEGLNKKPYPYFDLSTSNPEAISGHVLKMLISSALYQPLAKFQLLSDLFLGLEKRSPDVDILRFIGIDPTDEQICSCKLYDRPRPGSDAQAAILCGDGPELDEDIDDFTNYYKFLVNQSSTMGAFMAHARMSCVGWKSRAAWKFKPQQNGGKTSHPLLFIGNVGDPVTPLANAVNMAKKFDGARVLTQNSIGHCSISSPSVCSFRYIRDYFQKGTLPPKNTTCQPEFLPFLGLNGVTAGIMSAEDEFVVRGMIQQLKDAIPKLGFDFRF